MDIGTALSVAQTLFAALQCSELKEICSFFGKESELIEFKSTVETVKAVLLDAQDKEVVSNKHEAELYIQRLKDAVYNADDLLDEFVTLAEQKKHMKDEKFFEKLRHIFSSSNPFVVAHKMSHEVKKIKKTLDAIASDHNNFGFKVDSRPIRKRREETCSYVYESDIVGREADMEFITSLLSDSNAKEHVSFLTIVGIGGLGKTALAQLVFNDATIKSAFPLRLWVCVSDHEQEELDVEGILRKIWASILGEKDEKTTLDSVQDKVRAKLANNKYLLVLDDVWTKKRKQWTDLVKFLLGAQEGSWIVVTTRSHETAKVVVGGRMRELQGLSREDSELLFKKIAFGADEASPREDLIEIGREIVEQCVGNPLAIRVAGSLLYGQDITKWLLFKKTGLFNSRDSQKDIMAILKLSYDQLESPLKSCFSYCALFPKDFEMEKEVLVNLWLAQGFVVPLDKGQTVDDAAEEYFSILLRRCFFQDVEHDEFGGIYSCKMHDLMHDVAQQVAGKEIYVSDPIINVDEKVRHVSVMSSEYLQHSFTKMHIRSHLFGDRRYPVGQQYVNALVENWVFLRVLDLSGRDLKSLPNSIGKLKHLRYLDLSENDMKVLPKSITKLYNLEALKLAWCCELKKLPDKLSKLVKIRILDLEGCAKLTHMPMGLDKLSCLHTLNRFVVKSVSWEKLFDGLEELKSLTSLKGKLHIVIKFPYNDAKMKQGYKREGGYLRNLKHLSYISIEFLGWEEEIIGEEAFELVEELQPHANVKIFEIKGFDFRKRKGSCGRQSKLKLPAHSNLINLNLDGVSIEHVTLLGIMPHLKTLNLEELRELEDITIDGGATSAAAADSCETTASTSSRSTVSNGEGLFSLFPSLEVLVMLFLPKMKGWRRLKMGAGDKQDDELLNDSTSTTIVDPLRLLLPRLKELEIKECPNMGATLQCPVLEELKLKEFNKRLQIIAGPSKELGDEEVESTTCHFVIEDVKWLNSLPTLSFRRLTSMTIQRDKEVESLGEEVGEVVFSSMTSLRKLFIEHCSKLRSVVNGGLEHLPSLEKLVIDDCRELWLTEEAKRDGIDTALPCPSFYHSLRTLRLFSLPEMVELPSWMQFLTNLKFLHIRWCDGLESMPNWMPKLTSLQQLQLIGCSRRLNERCQGSTGEDWDHIKHIPLIEVDFETVQNNAEYSDEYSDEDTDED